MAIDKTYFEVLTSTVEFLRSEESRKDQLLRVGCLSYPDLLVTPAEIIEKFPALATAEFVKREDSEKIKKWHGITHLDEVIETSDFFSHINCSTDYFDYAEIRGGEKVVDLNHPISDMFHGNYDLVVDTGTLEHCFNVGVAFTNMCRLASVGGVIISAAPLCKINHGFWNFSPCAYENYFRQNNFEGLFFKGFHKRDGVIEAFDVLPNQRQICPTESSLICVVRRTIQSTFNFPTQQKYLT